MRLYHRNPLHQEVETGAAVHLVAASPVWVAVAAVLAVGEKNGKAGKCRQFLNIPYFNLLNNKVHYEGKTDVSCVGKFSLLRLV